MTSLALGLLLLVLTAPPATPWIIKQPTCRANCFLTAENLLHCQPPSMPNPPGATPIECSASLMRDGLHLLIGEYENAEAIAPQGLSVFASSFVGRRLLLQLRVKLTLLDPNTIFPVLPNLRTLALLEPPKQPCIFANVTAPNLTGLEFECVGVDLWRPFELVLPSTNPRLQLKKCGLSLECRSCGSRKIAVAIKNPRIQSQRMPSNMCTQDPDKECPACAISLETTTTTIVPSTIIPSSASPSSSPSFSPKEDSKTSPTAASAVAVSGHRPQRISPGTMTRQNALVKGLELRLARTQNLLIVILCLTLANSFVLIGLCGYFARRRRWTFCGQRKDIYSVAKTSAT